MSQPQLAVSTVIFALRAGKDGKKTLMLPLVQRIREPQLGLWALPGGPLADNEDLSDAAARNLRTTTGLEPRYLEQLYAFGDPERSPEQRVVSIVYWALVESSEADKAYETENVKWFEADCLPDLAFDHNLIVEYALWRLRTKLNYSRVAHGFLGESFTLAQLREVYETVLQREIDPANFRRSIETNGGIVATGTKVSGGSHRPPQLYTYDKSLNLADQGPLTRSPRNKTEVKAS
ncbi:MAG: NUDIX hydrolase [Micrococcales bacterium]